MAPQGRKRLRRWCYQETTSGDPSQFRIFEDSSSELGDVDRGDLNSTDKLAELIKQRLADFSPASATRVDKVGRMTTEHATAVFADIAVTFTIYLFALCSVIATTC